jgi:hypothetical protein
MTRTELATQLREHVKQFEAVETIALLPHQRRMVSVAKSAELCSSALTIAAALEEAERENRELRDALLAITIEGDGTNEHRIASEALSPTTTALDEGKTHTPKGGDALCSNDE